MLLLIGTSTELAATSFQPDELQAFRAFAATASSRNGRSAEAENVNRILNASPAASLLPMAQAERLLGRPEQYSRTQRGMELRYVVAYLQDEKGMSFTRLLCLHFSRENEFSHASYLHDYRTGRRSTGRSCRVSRCR